MRIQIMNVNKYIVTITKNVPDDITYIDAVSNEYQIWRDQESKVTRLCMQRNRWFQASYTISKLMSKLNEFIYSACK